MTIRLAEPSDTAAISQLIQLSVRGLQAEDYSPEQIEEALQGVFGVDSQLIADRTYFVIESSEKQLIACGGWSRRRTLFVGDQFRTREPELLDPATEAAKIRAFFVHPDWARRGLGSKLLECCEEAALSEGFTSFEMGATLTGVPLYRAKGYSEVAKLEVPLNRDVRLPIVRMTKVINPA